jgi:hypothetical protein
MVKSFQFGGRDFGRSRIVAALLLIGVSLLQAAFSAEVEARLDRESVTAGNGAVLTIRIAGGRAESPQIPAVENLIVQPRGRNQEMRIVNGRTSVAVTFNYVVGSNTPGDYEIPAFEVEVDGVKLMTQPLKLKVLDAAAAQPPAGLPANPPGSQAAGEGEEDSAGRRFGFLTVELAANDRKHAYVGEIAPVRIRAWLPADSRANLRSGIQPEGKAFTLHNVSDQPQQSHEMKDGKRYLVVTWFGGISATKAGKYPASLSVDATVAVRDPSAPKPRGRTGDPFFDNIFEDMNIPMIQKDVTLKSDDQEIEIRPLPKEGRPDGFTGAVGSFKFDDWQVPSDWKTGEPRQVQARLSGTGNFALMKAPTPTPADEWKVYPGKDEFTPGDEASFSGNKVFQFSAVPRRGGERKMALEFSFFDPAAAEYRTITSPVKSIKVAGEDMPEDLPEVAPSSVEPVKKEERMIAQQNALSPRASLVPLVSRPVFVTLLATSGGLCLLGGCMAWFRGFRSDPRRLELAAMEKATRDALHAAGHCAAADDQQGFFAAGRLAIQHRLAGLWNQPAHAITLAEIMGRLPSGSPVARFFGEADRLAYGRSPDGRVETEWKALLDEAMACLTKKEPLT